MLSNIVSYINPFRKKTEFTKICRNNGLLLNYKENKRYYPIFRDIFQIREYSNHFPFYEKCTILDIGAHVGYFSLFAHVNTHPESIIYAIEPNQTNFKQLKNNIAINKMHNVFLDNIAIGELAGERPLYLGKSENHTIIKQRHLSESIPVERTNVETLSGFIKKNKIEKIDFLKIDCEGAEYEIFESMNTEDFNNIQPLLSNFMI